MNIKDSNPENGNVKKEQWEMPKLLDLDIDLTQSGGAQASTEGYIRQTFPNATEDQLANFTS